MGAWRARDPVARFRSWLVRQGWWDEAREAELRRSTRQEVRLMGRCVRHVCACVCDVGGGMLRPHVRVGASARVLDGGCSAKGGARLRRGPGQYAPAVPVCPCANACVCLRAAAHVCVYSQSCLPRSPLPPSRMCVRVHTLAASPAHPLPHLLPPAGAARSAAPRGRLGPHPKSIIACN